MKWIDEMHHPEKYWKVFIKWGLLGLVMGLIGGVLAAVEGEAYLYDFALKLLFTAVTLSAGFKGGEIVPTFLHPELPFAALWAAFWGLNRDSQRRWDRWGCSAAPPTAPLPR